MVPIYTNVRKVGVEAIGQKESELSVKRQVVKTSHLPKTILFLTIAEYVGLRTQNDTELYYGP